MVKFILIWSFYILPNWKQSSTMIKIKTLVLSLSLYVAVFAQGGGPSAIDGVAAIIGEHLVLKSEVNQMVLMAAVQQRLDPAKDVERIKLLQDQILGGLVDQKILLEMAAEDSIVVEEKEVDQALDQQIDVFVSQAGGEDQAETMLGQSIASFRREYWYEMRDKLITERFQQEKISMVSVSRDEVISFFNAYKDSLPPFPNKMKIRHLLVQITPGEKSKQTAYDLVLEIRRQVAGGAPFDSLAMKYSADPGSAASGGSLGYVKRGALVPEFESVAFTIPVGELSQPVETQFGYHLIEALDRRGDKVHARHILIAPELSAEDENIAYSFILSLKDSINNIADFKTLVEKHSDDSETKKIGGDLGWINLSNYPIPEFRMVADRLERSVPNGPLKTDLGYHLVWLEGIRPGGRPSLERHWFDLELLALNQKRIAWYQDWMEMAREKFMVTLYE